VVGTESTGLTYVGHATVLIELGGRRLLTDPMLGAGILHVRRQAPMPALTDLRQLDAILISHAHLDHLHPASLRRLADDCPVVVPRGSAALARRGGAQKVIELDQGDRVTLGGVVVEAVPAAHHGRRHRFSRSVVALGYVLEGPHTLYFAGDTDLFAEMTALAGRVDLALLPIWGWSPRVPSGHLDPVRAAEAVARIRPDVAVPIHWGTLRRGGLSAASTPSPRRERLPMRSAAQRPTRTSESWCLDSGWHCQ
jgi:L-ascorbate metabolism protein UlaG (beta-lactamase superfamily)